MTTIQAIRDDFAFLDEWEDQIHYVIDLGAELPPFPDEARIDTFKVPGCQSQVWLITRVGEGTDPIIKFQGDSDSDFVRGLVAIILTLFSSQHASHILRTDAERIFNELGLAAHLHARRRNGLRSMVERIKRDAAFALKQTA